MVDDIINTAKTRLNRFRPDNAKTKDKNPQFHKIVWATSFTNCINLTDKEKHLNSLSTVVFKRPAALQNLLTNYKQISLNLQRGKTIKMDLFLLVVIVLFVVIMEHIKTWSKTLILSKLKMVKLSNLNKISTALISVYTPLVVIYALKFILVKL